MLFHCDYVLASKTATFSTPFIHLGLVPEGASSLLMPRTMGHQRAFSMLVMGRNFSADEAREAGFVNVVVAPGHTEAEARKVAREICALPAEAVAISRKLLKLPPEEHDAPDRPGEPSVRRTDALQRSGRRVQGVLCPQEGVGEQRALVPPSLRAQRSNQFFLDAARWIASLRSQ